MIAIETSGLTKKFDGLVAVDHLDMEVEQGEIFGLLGPNGAGKTTTIRMLLDIIKPDEGTIRLLGRVLSPLSLGPVLRPPSVLGPCTCRPWSFGPVLRPYRTKCPRTKGPGQVPEDQGPVEVMKAASSPTDQLTCQVLIFSAGSIRRIAVSDSHPNTI